MKHAEHNPFNRNYDQLESLADAIGDELQAPVTIEDANHRLLAYSKHDPQSDPARIATIVSRRVPEHVITSLWKDGAMKRLMESDEPVRIRAIGEVGLGSRVAASIRKDGHVLGYIWALETGRPLTEEQLLLLKQAAYAARGKLLRLQTEKRKEEEERNDFFWELLHGHLDNPERIRSHAHSLGIRLPASYQLHLFHVPNPIDLTLQQQMQYVWSTSHTQITCHTYTRHHAIVLMAPSNEQAVPSFLTQMAERFGMPSIQAAVSSTYNDYSCVENSYQEALTVLQMKQRFPAETAAVLYYDQLGYFRLLPAIADHHRKHRYTNPILHKLRQYDADHGGHLLHTLETFLRCDSNIKDTADTLHIHANTLSYRLKRISDISGMQWNNADQKLSVLMDLRVETWMQQEPL